MKAKELMTPTPKVCTSDDRIVDVARMMRDYDVGSLPVVENSGMGHATSGGSGRPKWRRCSTRPRERPVEC